MSVTTSPATASSADAAKTAADNGASDKNAPKFCARHPKVETVLACGRCLTPICPSCAISGAVGMLCPTCGGNQNNKLYDVKPERLALTALAGIGCGIVAGFILDSINGYFVFLSLFIAPIIGGFVGEAMLRASGRKTGRTMEIITVVSVVVGAAFSLILDNNWWILFVPKEIIIFLVGVGITCFTAVRKIHHL